MEDPWNLEYDPRRWQKRAFERWSASNSGVVEVVTGAGKTFFSFMCMIAFSQRHDEGRINIVVPTLSIADQWIVALQDELNVEPRDIGIFSGEEKSDQPGSVNVIVINTARRLGEKLSKNTPTFLVVDECHRAATPENSKALRGDHSATLGLSATPRREYDDGFERYIVPKIGGIIYEYGYEDAVEDGIVAEFELVNVRVPLSPQEEKEYNKYDKAVGSFYSRKEGGEDVQEAYERVLRKRAEVATLAEARIPTTVHIAEQYRGARTMVFHERIDAADMIYDLLKSRDHSVTRYHSGIGADIRRSNLQMYRRGYVDSIVACRALDEGVNVPDTEVAILAASTASRRQRIQRLGRVLRPKDSGAVARIYTLYCSGEEERRLSKEAAVLDDTAKIEWRRATIG